MTTTSKKPKTANDNDDFETVKRYLLDCPHVAPDHPAIKSALEGIEKEQARRERDAKLQRKFAVSAGVSSSNNSTATSSNLSDSVVVVDGSSAPASAPNNHDSDEMLEWQDVSDKPKDDEDGEPADGNSFLGKKLAKIAIDSISQYQVKVKSPVAAIVAVLHASLRSEVFGFSCTGIPEDSKTAGFAAPVRELPQTVFFPPKWDASQNKISLRYRKDGTGATVLTVQSDADNRIKISFQPSTSKEPSGLALSFAVDEHVNLDSWQAALKVSPAVSPALHYKSLALLLSNFARTFDLGSVDEIDEGQSAALYVDNTVPASQPLGRAPVVKSDFVSPAQPVPAIAMQDRRRKPWEDGVPATIDQAFPSNRPMPSGDFHGDLAPAGLRDPRFVPGQPGMMPGSQMGPNHPMFRGDGTQGPHVGGPGSMQPRFDPFHPPGIDVDIDGRPMRNRPSRTGVPNPDHLPPPNSFSSDMYM